MCIRGLRFGLVLLSVFAVSVMSSATFVGVIEGYYWPSSESVNGNYGFYTFEQRIKLLELLKAKNISLYVFCPQEYSNLDIWSSATAEEWAQTSRVAQSLGIRFVFGLRPGFIDAAVNASVIAKLQQIKDVGIKDYGLQFDDAAGAGSDSQQLKQSQLASTAASLFPDLTLALFVPSAYRADMFSSRAEWETKLVTVDTNISSSVAMAFTGLVTNPSQMNDTQLPYLSSGRRRVFFDNWIAVDTSSRIPWGLIRRRATNFFASQSLGYLLNLAYPLERVIHQIECLGELASGSSACSASTASSAWALWLQQNGFLHQQNFANVSAALLDAIQRDTFYASIAALEAAYPSLSGVFSSPPTLPPSASVTPSSTSGSPTTPSSTPPSAAAPQPSVAPSGQTSRQPQTGTGNTTLLSVVTIILVLLMVFGAV